MDKDLVFCRLTLVNFLAALLTSTLLVIFREGLFDLIGLGFLTVAIIIFFILTERLKKEKGR